MILEITFKIYSKYKEKLPKIKESQIVEFLDSVIGIFFWG